MQILNNYISPISPRMIRSGERIDCEPHREDVGNFDKVTLQRSNLSPEQSFTLEMIGRVTQEVRAATTTGDIQSLHDKVAAGQYQIDVDEIVRRILLQ
ncbi:MAG: hypothetical protein KHY89_02375 [Butyricicoccus pullicaecorum]|nr:hypothetical protein [Butyricicoccus pullicaecorum]